MWSNYILLASCVTNTHDTQFFQGPLFPSKSRGKGKNDPADWRAGWRKGRHAQRAGMTSRGRGAPGATGVGPKGGEEQDTDEVEKFSQVPRGLASVGC